MRGLARMCLGSIALVPGCFSAPTRPEATFDAGGDGGPSLTVTPGTKLVVATADYTMTFAAGGWKMPESLVMNARPAVERLSFTQPFGENAIGLSLWPTYTVNAGAAPGGTATRTLGIAGPAKAVVDVRWNGPEHCAGSGALANNLARFTFYPDGRIVRHDEINTMAACSNNLGTVNSFVWSAGMIGSYIADGTSESFPAPPQNADIRNLGRAATGSVCLQDPTSAIGFTWFPPATVADWDRIEIQIYPDTYVAALFWAEDLDTIASKTYIADTTLIIRDGGTSCDDLAVPLAAQQSPPTIANAAYRSTDGVYLVGGIGTLTAQADVPTGFVLELASVSSVILTRQSAVAARTRRLVPGVDYIEQRDGMVVTWFMIDALFTGESLVLSE